MYLCYTCKYRTKKKIISSVTSVVRALKICCLYSLETLQICLYISQNFRIFFYKQTMYSRSSFELRFQFPFQVYTQSKLLLNLLSFLIFLVVCKRGHSIAMYGIIIQINYTVLQMKLIWNGEMITQSLLMIVLWRTTEVVRPLIILLNAHVPI